MTQPKRKRARSRDREEGIAMLVVMLVLLMVTATATFAAHSTSMDIRAAGHTRIAMQTHNLATTALLGMADYTERQGIQAVIGTIARSTQGGAPLVLTGLEPPLAPGKEGARFYAADLGSGVANPAPSDSFGARDPHVPSTTIDVYDVHTYSIPIAGQRADGLSPFRFVRTTFTARARARVSAGGSSYVTNLETASDARAHVVAGPAFF